MLFSVVVLLDRDVAVAPVFPELVIGGNKVQREGFAHEVELRRIADTRTGLELCRTFGCSGLIRPFVGIFDGNLHVLAEISAVRGVAQQKQVLVAYRADGTVGSYCKPCLVVIYLVCAGIGAAVGVESSSLVFLLKSMVIERVKWPDKVTRLTVTVSFFSSP